MPFFKLLPLLSCFFAIMSCQTSSSTGPEMKTMDKAPTVYFENPESTISIQVELAITPEERSRGLMFRQRLPQDQGMLFIAPAPTVQKFWMKNTYLPLDMIFIDKSGKIVGIVHNAEPLSHRPRGVDIPSLMVLEVNGGFCKRYGITDQTKLSFQGLPPRSRN